MGDDYKVRFCWLGPCSVRSSNWWWNIISVPVRVLQDILSVNWRHITDLVSAKGKIKEVYCCDIVVLIVLFWCFWCVKDYNVKSVYWNIVWWGCKSISINWLLFSPLPKLGQLSGCDINWPREYSLGSLQWDWNTGAIVRERSSVGHTSDKDHYQTCQSYPEMTVSVIAENVANHNPADQCAYCEHNDSWNKVAGNLVCKLLYRCLYITHTVLQKFITQPHTPV